MANNIYVMVTIMLFTKISPIHHVPRGYYYDCCKHLGKQYKQYKHYEVHPSNSHPREAGTAVRIMALRLDCFSF